MSGKPLLRRQWTGNNRFSLLLCCIVLLFVFHILSFSSDGAAAPRPERILFISSYHPGFPTFFQQIDGLNSVFAREKIKLDIEFMDSKRFYNTQNFKYFYQLIRHKLLKLPPYRVVITADDNALLFILKHKEELLPDTPIVFMGVNSVDLALKQNSNPDVTGVIEAVSMEETIDLIARLHPEAKEITAIVDGTPSGQGDLKTFYKLQKKTGPLLLSHISLTDFLFSEFSARLKEINDRRVFLLLSAYRDKNNRSLLFHESLKLIRSSLQLPLYHLWYHGLGDGIVGGKLISHYHQGKNAAEIVLRILKGEDPGNIKVETVSPNQYMFDYNELVRFKIDLSGLPDDHTIINKPETFYSRHKYVLLLTLFITLGFTLLTAVLLVNIMRRKKAESELRKAQAVLEEKVRERTRELREANLELNRKIQEVKISENALKESEVRFRSLSEAAFEGICFSENGKIIEVNRQFTEMLGYEQEEVIGMDVIELVFHEDRDLVRGQVLSESESLYEHRILRKNGDLLDVEVQAKMIVFGGRKMRVKACRDVTRRKLAEKEKEKLIQKLKNALDEVKKLSGLIPICSHCKKIRDDKGYWKQIEEYIEQHSEAQFSHGLCKECVEELYKDTKWLHKREKKGSG
jgi:PAS domain S-box-containing protein